MRRKDSGRHEEVHGRTPGADYGVDISKEYAIEGGYRG